MKQKHRRISKDWDTQPRAPGAALAIVCVAALVLCYGAWAIAKPLYWKIYAELTHISGVDSDERLRARLVSELIQGKLHAMNITGAWCINQHLSSSLTQGGTLYPSVPALLGQPQHTAIKRLQAHDAS